jgi:hypothetical protein
MGDFNAPIDGVAGETKMRETAAFTQNERVIQSRGARDRSETWSSKNP